MSKMQSIRLSEYHLSGGVSCERDGILNLFKVPLKYELYYCNRKNSSYFDLRETC